MAPTKRARPAFSPPRPKTSKSKSAAPSKSTASGAKRTGNGVVKKGKQPSKTVQSKPKKAPESRRRSKLVSPTPSASDSLGDESEENEDEDEDEDTEDENMRNSNNNDRSDEERQSPEPDFILAEVTHENQPSLSSIEDPPIPFGLVHRILSSHFQHPEKTKISTDAREMAGKYIEIFVREAIVRCAYAKTEGNQGQDGEALTTGDGWLEVEDLEKTAVQLCLDF